MLLKAGGGGSEYKTLETGTYDAICVDPNYPIMKQYSPQDKPKPTVMFVFEVNKRRVRLDGTEDNKNYMVFSKNLTLTMAPKGHLAPTLESWLGKQFKTGDEINLEDFVGKPAKLMIAEEPRKSGKGTYAKIVKIMPSDVSFETDPDFERKDPSTYSDDIVREKTEASNAPF